MATQFHCRRERRRQEVRDHPDLNGIDYLEVLDRDAVALGMPRQRTLLVHCLKPLDPAISAANVRIEGGVRVTPVLVVWARRATEVPALALPDDSVLVVRTDSHGDFSTYRLRLVTDDAPLTGFDPPLTEVDFSFKVECPSEFDCAPRDECPPEPSAAPPIDYLARDYASFRRLMLDRIATIMPEWRERNPADAGVAMVEVLAYAADRLAYHQDAVATEAYLGTARRRPSVRRHARLLDYRMHDGCNARAWVTVRAGAGTVNEPFSREYLPGSRTRLLTLVPSRGTAIAEEEFADVLTDHRPEVYEPMFDLRLFEAHNDLFLYTWSDEQCCLPKGATRATLRDDADALRRLRLRPGDVLIFEEVRGPATGQEPDADPAHRHAVRLTRVDPEAEVDPDGVRTPGPLRTDALNDQPVVEIEWGIEDALPFPLCVSTLVRQGGEDVLVTDVSIAHGNVVLVDHGRAVLGEEESPTGDRRYRLALTEPDVTQRVPFSAEDWAATPPGESGGMSATGALAQEPREALPDVAVMSGEHEDWRAVRDLLASDRFDPHCVVETESDGRAVLRFGDDVFGRTPESGVFLRAAYRVGSGPAGNTGADAIRHVLTTPGLDIQEVRNPLPAVGGVAPETLEEVRHHAPQAFRTQERAVTAQDYQAVAERHPEVDRAVARRLWTGSWHTIFIAVDRTGGLEVDRKFEDELSAFVERFQLTGHDVEIEPPIFVPLDMALRVCVESGHLRSDVKQELLRVFGRRDLPDGRRGFFHPDRFTFGQPVYLSQVIAAAMAVPGVRWVEVDETAEPPGRFQRWGEISHGEIENGFIDIRGAEIARLDNDPNAAENGRIEFHLEGGL